MPSPAPKMVKFQDTKSEVSEKEDKMLFTQKSIQSNIAPFTTDGHLGKEKTDSWKAVMKDCTVLVYPK